MDGIKNISLLYDKTWGEIESNCYLLGFLFDYLSFFVFVISNFQFQHSHKLKLSFVDLVIEFPINYATVIFISHFLWVEIFSNQASSSSVPNNTSGVSLTR